MKSDARRPRVVVVGAGFAGLHCVMALAGADVDVTVVDRRNFHLFQPLLYQVATATLSPGDIARPIRTILRRQDNVDRVVLGEVTRIDRVGRSLELADGEILNSDALVVATGVTHAYFGHDEWSALAPGLKTVEDALEIRRRIVSCLERSERGAGRAPSFVVVGAGPTGVELAGAIAEIVRRDVADEYRTADVAAARVVVIERADRVLPGHPPAASARARADLAELGVEVRLGSAVTAVEHDAVVVDGAERLAADVTVWAAGVTASPLARQLGAVADSRGRVLVDADLSIPGDPSTFVIGDLAAVPGVPGVAPAAIQQGRHVARMLRQDRRGRARIAFRYRDRGSVATIGRGRAVVDVGRVHLRGRAAWTVWLVIHLVQLAGFRNRAAVAAAWTWEIVRSGRRPVRLIVGGGTEPVPAGEVPHRVT